MLKIGDTAPLFTANTGAGGKISLADFKGKKIVLYFYPKDNTPGCTAQACDLRDNYERFLNQGYVVIGVSKDSEASHQNFSQKYSLPFPLVSDTDTSILQMYDAWGEKSLYGKKYMGVLRKTFVIDEQGRIIDIIEKVNTKAHSVQILK